MSTTGWRVGTSVTVDADRLERSDGLVRSLGASALTLEHERSHAFIDCRQVAVQQLLGLVRLRGDVCALTQLEHGLLRGRPVAAGSRDEPALVVRDRKRRRGERLLDRLGQPRHVLAVQRGDRRDRRRVARRVAPALLHASCAARMTSLQVVARGLSGAAVISHVSPGHACAASSVSAVAPSWLTQTSTSASRSGWRTSSSACTASPPVCAAWNDVPQPVKSNLASGKRRSVGTRRSHSGCAAIAARVSSPFAMRLSIPSTAP